MNDLDFRLDQYIDDNKERFLEELFALLRQPSISTRNEGITECAELLVRQMQDVGIATQVFPTARHPIIYGEALKEGAPTVLIYGHYDVQPPEPLELWDSPPFEPEIRNGKIYGRGTSDNKAQIFIYLKAIEAFRAVLSELPLSFKFMFEGEEEIGSPNLAPFVESHRELLAADITYFSDSHIHESGRPMVILGLKGMAYVELRARTTSGDQHSMRATGVPSATWRLIWALNTLKTPDNRIAIEGFYDDVRPLTPLEAAAIDRIPEDEAALKQLFGVDALLPGRVHDGYYFNLITEPTCNVAGIFGGYTGPGSKTVLPATATAKLDMRLVPNQKPADIVAKLRQHLDAHGFDDIEIHAFNRVTPSRTPVDHPVLPVITQTLEEVYGSEAIVFPNIGGAGPNYVFTDILGQPCFEIPHATHDQANHAPNESMDLAGFINGMRTLVRVFPRLIPTLRALREGTGQPA
ncbi:M20/M25/M40 family metallo-hydrolase [Bosea sp. Root381]|uniref:M20/M25/M40 family metallo-hydrolase n=1 Tax=Bosea sp. Root381 TaxID=1736524 RepID=UPI0009E9783E|nr:M20/M25/M40 family metallo-hydrolase [Bosea sp. Root381]